MNDQKAERVYVDKWGDEIDLSVIYGVYKTPSGLTGFFQRCTNYSSDDIQEAVKYITSNIEPKRYSKSQSKKMMIQIEGSDFSENSGTKDRAPRKDSKLARAFLGAMLMVLFITVSYVFLFWNPGGSAPSGEAITLNEFYEIETGMTYQEVVQIIGCDGELSSESSLLDSTYQIYTWKGNGTIGANANVSFTDGRVTSKAQAGLE